jgi:uncharacterized protein YlzI (FlbEa/FlbD family)
VNRLELLELSGDWVDPREIAALQPHPDGGTTVYLRSGLTLAVPTMPERVIQRLTEWEER